MGLCVLAELLLVIVLLFTATKIHRTIYLMLIVSFFFKLEIFSGKLSRHLNSVQKCLINSLDKCISAKIEEEVKNKLMESARLVINVYFIGLCTAES